MVSMLQVLTCKHQNEADLEFGMCFFRFDKCIVSSISWHQHVRVVFFDGCKQRNFSDLIMINFTTLLHLEKIAWKNCVSKPSWFLAFRFASIGNFDLRRFSPGTTRRRNSHCDRSAECVAGGSVSAADDWSTNQPPLPETAGVPYDQGLLKIHWWFP